MSITSQLRIDAPPIVVARSRRRRPRQLVCRVLHLGAGRQSSVLAEMIVRGELPRMDLVIFCDTGDEPSWVYEQLEYLAGRLESVGILLTIARKSDRGIVGDLQSTDGSRRFSSLPFFTRDPISGKVARLKRQCTSEYKIEPADSTVLAWLLERDYAQIVHDSLGRTRRVVRGGLLTEHYYGISYEEFYRAGKRGPAWQQAIYPLIDRRMSALDCVRWLRERGLRVPKKSSCRICPFHDDGYWLDLQIEASADFEAACAFDDWLRTPAAKRGLLHNLRDDVFLHKSCQPLRAIDFAAAVASKASGAPAALDLCGDHCMT